MTNDNLFIFILPMKTLSILLATSHACLVSSNNFPSQASSMIWKISQKQIKGKMQKKAIMSIIVSLSFFSHGIVILYWSKGLNVPLESFHEHNQLNFYYVQYQLEHFFLHFFFLVHFQIFSDLRMGFFLCTVVVGYFVCLLEDG